MYNFVSLSRYPTNVGWPFALLIETDVESNTALYPESHNYPLDNNDPVNCGNTSAIRAANGNAGKFNIPV